MLVPEGDAAALARALEALARDPARRRALGEAGCARVRGEFALEENLERLALKFGLGRDAGRLLRTA
jgi:glycosyltransferase involved in cell wall biosynthesis